MIKVSHSDMFGEIGVRNMFIEYKGFQISLAGYSHHETIAVNKTWTHMDEMKLYLDGKDITERHPNWFGYKVPFRGIEDLLDVIKLIDMGFFRTDISKKKGGE